MLTLKIHDADGTVREVELTRFPCTIGRGEANQVRIVDSRVSRAHGRIEETPEGYVFHDLGSTHGTFHDGKRVTEIPFGGGVTLQLGGITIESVRSKEEVTSDTDIVQLRARAESSRPPEPSYSPSVAKSRPTRKWMSAATLLGAGAVLVYLGQTTMLVGLVSLSFIMTMVLALFCKLNTRSYRFGALFADSVMIWSFLCVSQVVLRLFYVNLASPMQTAVLAGSITAIGLAFYLLATAGILFPRLDAASFRRRVRNPVVGLCSLLAAAALATPSRQFIITMPGYVIRPFTSAKYPVDAVMAGIDRSIAKINLDVKKAAEKNPQTPGAGDLLEDLRQAEPPPDSKGEE